MSVVDRIFVGKVIKKAMLEEEFSRLGGSTKSALLVQREEGKALALKLFGWFLITFSVRYYELTMESAHKLRDLIDEAEQIVDGQYMPDQGKQTGVLDPFYVGKVFKEIPLEEKSFIIAKEKKSALLGQKENKVIVAVKISGWTMLLPFGASAGVAYFTLNMEGARKLRDFIYDAEQL